MDFRRVTMFAVASSAALAVLIRRAPRLAVRLVLILPLQLVFPVALSSFVGRGLRDFARQSNSNAPTSFVQGTPSPSSFWMWAIRRAGRQALRLWLTSELWFAAFYFFRRRALQRQPLMIPPPISAAARLKLGKRCLSAIDEIDYHITDDPQRGNEGGSGDTEEDGARSVSARGSRSASKEDLHVAFDEARKRLHQTRSEMSFEAMIRLWDEDKDVTTAGKAPGRGDSDAPGAAMDVEVQKLTLKRAALSGWFLGADCRKIRRGNVAQWVAWAFFLAKPQELNAARRKEMDALVDEVSRWANIQFEHGFDPSIRCIRLDFDPIPSTYRPLVYYAVTAGFFSIITDLVFTWFGFTKLKSGCLTYWHRAPSCSHHTDDGSRGREWGGRGEEEEPIVFCHGLGIGVLSYVKFIYELVGRYAPRRRIFLVSLPHISMRPVETQASPRELVTSISLMLAAHGCRGSGEPSLEEVEGGDGPMRSGGGCHFVGHSFGSIVCAWVMRIEPQLCNRMTFLDPVCFLLCKHDVAYNFLYKQANTAGELLMQWFVGRELYIAYTLSRRFFWQDNILWPEQLRCPTTVVLSAEDHIVPSHAIRRHLTSWCRRRSKYANRNERGGGGEASPPPIKVVWLPDLGHAGFLTKLDVQKNILLEISQPFVAGR